MLSSNCRAWTLKLSEHLKKITKFSIKIRLKRTLIRQLKRTINQSKKNYMRKKNKNCKNVLLYTINNISMVLEIIIIYCSCILKLCLEILFLNLNLTVPPTSSSYFSFLKYLILSTCVFSCMQKMFGKTYHFSFCHALVVGWRPWPWATHSGRH